VSRQLIALVAVVMVCLAATTVVLVVRALRRRSLRREREQRRRELQTAMGTLARAALPERLEGVVRGIELLRDEGVASAVRGSIAALASGALSDTRRMRRAAGPDGTLTLMFSDIEGSTALNERLGDAGWLDVLGRHNRIVREQLRRHRGEEVKAQGDGFMLAFARPGDAVACAVATQRAIAGERWDLGRSGRSGRALRVRIGLHCGEVVRHGDDFLGLNVTIAARVAQHARGGEILASAAVVDSLDDAGATVGLPRTVRFKGIVDEQLVYPVAWSA
jgi:adenylate cyclase